MITGIPGDVYKIHVGPLAGFRQTSWDMETNHANSQFHHECV